MIIPLAPEFTGNSANCSTMPEERANHMSIQIGDKVAIKKSFDDGKSIIKIVVDIDKYGAHLRDESGICWYQAGSFNRLDDQSVPIPKSPRQIFPYGKWTCADGREVLFNRYYNPIWSRSPNGTVTEADPAERIPFVHQIWFYTPKNPPWYSSRTLKKCEAILAAWTGAAPVVRAA